MSNGKECIYVRCPYYRREDRKLMQLKCEGMVEGTDLYQRFENLNSLLSHKERYCKSNFSRCPWRRHWTGSTTLFRSPAFDFGRGGRSGVRPVPFQAPGQTGFLSTLDVYNS